MFIWKWVVYTVHPNLIEPNLFDYQTRMYFAPVFAGGVRRRPFNIFQCAQEQARPCRFHAQNSSARIMGIQPMSTWDMTRD